MHIVSMWMDIIDKYFNNIVFGDNVQCNFD